MTFIVLFPLITLLLYGGLSYVFFFYTQKEQIKKDLSQYETTFIETEQENLKGRLENLTQFIHYYDGRSGEKIKEDVRNIISVTADVANNLYHSYKNTVDENRLKEIIKSALSKIKFEGDIGYLFLLDLKGNVHIHVDEKLIGKNILNIRDVNGKYILKEFNKVIKKKGEGFVDYYWYIVGEDKQKMHYKISFVKKIDAYDWYVGAGEYLKYMTKFVRKDILKYIKANAEFKNGYFFITNSLNEIVFQPDNNKIRNNGEDLKHFRMDGLYKDDRNIAYTRYIAQYDWYVTVVKDLAEIQKNIENKKKESEFSHINKVKTNLYLMLFTWVVSLLLSLYLSLLINRMLKNYQSEINDANEQLVFQSRQALIGELFPMIAHQWRQPVNKIASTLALLRFELLDKKLSHEEIDSRCHNIEEDIEFMSETIDDFRTFYQPKENSSKVNLRLLINKAVDFLEGSVQKKNIYVVRELANISYELHGNEFLQVMINVIKNAIDSISMEGTIFIKLNKTETDEILITVEDNGEGINANNLPKIFDPYYTTKEDSMGLGLYMSKMIIEKHMNGIIKAEALTQGTRFTLCFKPQKTHQ